MKKLRAAVLAGVVSALLALAGCDGGGGSGSTCTGTSAAALSDNPAGLEMVEHAPAGGGSASAIVVALHGCTQTAEAYRGAGWDELADAHGFAVIYPQQTTINNAQRCFRWWDAAHVTRDQGEARSIKAMVDAAKAKYGAQRAFVTGLSAGAAMAVAMLAAYPDVFEAGAIMAGIPYGCAKSLNDTFTCMSGKEQSGDAWADILPPDARAKPPRVSIWQGSADYLVRPANSEALVRQWTKAHGIDANAAASETIGSATHETYGDGAVERWTIANMGHGVALAPAEGCGKAGAFLLDVKLCSTRKAAEFFGLTGGGAPGTAAPRGGASSPGGTGADDGATHHSDCTE